jgi:hypothetical protein
LCLLRGPLAVTGVRTGILVFAGAPLDQRKGRERFGNPGLETNLARRREDRGKCRSGSREVA